jgi:exopolyphosphatase/guanosine-5'-triphosphate,3'-diphosphate pyrophosphatase
MNTRRLAVIDLGSNTFHLLICDVRPDGSWDELYRERRYVKLAAGGLEHLDEDRIERAVDCMTAFAETARAHQVSAIRATGTAAMREAGNGADLARRIHAACGISIEIIDGQAEAGYILRGIQAALPPTDRPALVMDIGGGSVEFILYHGPDIRFKASYRIGVAVLFRAYHREDPLTPAARRDMEGMLGEALAPLFHAVRAAGPYDLVGASGSFEILHSVRPHLQTAPHWAEIDLRGLPEYLESIVRLDSTARQHIPDIPLERVDYVVVAFVLIQYVLRQLPPERLFYCEYALKEGVMAELAATRI